MSGKKILLIDDEKDIRFIVKMALGRVGGFDVIQAGSGEEGLELASREKPDAILLDVMMPGLDGPSTLLRLRQQEECSQIPVIFLTAKTQRADIDRLMEMGPAGVLKKPFDPMRLPEDVKSLLGG